MCRSLGGRSSHTPPSPTTIGWSMNSSPSEERLSAPTIGTLAPTCPVSGSIMATADRRGPGWVAGGSPASPPIRNHATAPTAITPTTSPAISAVRLARAGKMSRRRAAACSSSSGGATSAPSTPVTLERRNSPSRPFNRWTPCSANVMPAPDTISRTDAGTSTSPGPPTDITRAAVFTTSPPGLPPADSSSPKLTPARISIPSSRTASVAATAQRIASAGRSNVAKNPSPAVSISRPPNRPSCRRMMRWCRAVSSTQRVLPISAAIAVEPTMSVNSTAPIARPAVRRCIAGVYAEALERWEGDTRAGGMRAAMPAGARGSGPRRRRCPSARTARVTPRTRRARRRRGPPPPGRSPSLRAHRLAIRRSRSPR